MDSKNAGPVRIQVHRDRCVGSSNCSMVLPQVFGQDEDEGLVELIDPTGGSNDLGRLQDVAYECPAQAIEVRDG
jgi:ferredoxin